MPRTAVFQNCIRGGGQPLGNCGDDQLVRLALFLEALGTGFSSRSPQTMISRLKAPPRAVNPPEVLT